MRSPGRIGVCSAANGDCRATAISRSAVRPGGCSGLELTRAKDAFGTFIGASRDAVAASLKNKDNTIAVNFVLNDRWRLSTTVRSVIPAHRGRCMTYWACSST